MVNKKTSHYFLDVWKKTWPFEDIWIKKCTIDTTLGKHCLVSVPVWYFKCAFPILCIKIFDIYNSIVIFKWISVANEHDHWKWIKQQFQEINAFFVEWGGGRLPIYLLKYIISVPSVSAPPEIIVIILNVTLKKKITFFPYWDPHSHKLNSNTIIFCQWGN